MSKLEVDAIEPQSGTTLTLGASGDTITVPSGATLSNSGIITNFESTGIDDNGTATAITIDSSERVGIGTASPSSALEVTSGDTDAIDIKTSGAIEITDDTVSSRAYAYLSRNAGDAMVGGNMRFDESVTTGTHIGYAKGTNLRGGSGIVFDNPTSGYGYISFVQNNDTGDDTWNVVERMRIDSSGNLQFNSGYGSVATAYGCRAWVNFDGSGTPSIAGSGNVSSITDNGTGNFTVNFTTAIQDNNYAVVATAIRSSSTGLVNAKTLATTSVSLNVYDTAGTNRDLEVGLAIFR